MIPKKAKEFKKEVAKELNLSEDLVDDVINFYWERVRKLITTADNNAIEILNLGTFKLKTWKIDETIASYKLLIERVDGHFAKYAIRKDYESRIEMLEKAKKYNDEEKERLNNIKIKRNADKAKGTLEE